MTNPLGKGAVHISPYALGFKFCTKCQEWLPPPNDDVLYHTCGKKVKTRPNCAFNHEKTLAKKAMR
jgi:hypothetical protein